MSATWGEEILKARKTKKMTREELAASIGTSVSTVIRWETGKSKPLPVFRRQLERVLGIDLSEEEG